MPGRHLTPTRASKGLYHHPGRRTPMAHHHVDDDTLTGRRR